MLLVFLVLVALLLLAQLLRLLLLVLLLRLLLLVLLLLLLATGTAATNVTACTDVVTDADVFTIVLSCSSRTAVLLDPTGAACLLSV